MSIRRARIKILAGVIKQPHRQRAISQARGDTPYRSLTMAKTNFDDPRYAATFKGGVMRWKNGRVPFPNVVAEAKAAGLPVDVEATAAARKADAEAFLAEFRRNSPPGHRGERAQGARSGSKKMRGDCGLLCAPDARQIVNG